MSYHKSKDDDNSLTISLPPTTTTKSSSLSPSYDTAFLSKICEGKHFESTVQNILYGAAGSESQKLREFLRKFTNAWQQQQKQQASNEKDLDMFFKSTRNFVSTISSDISKRFNKSLCRAIDDDSNKKSNEKDFV